MLNFTKRTAAAQRGRVSLYAELFQHLMSAYRNKEIPKQVRNGSRVFAFTLAEVLITLVIIGIVAALTIPNLMQKYTEQTTVKKVQKFYSNLSNAYNLAMKENGNINEWGITGHNEEGANIIYDNLFKPYFKISKDCRTTNTGDCMASAVYKHLNNNNDGGINFYSATKNYYKIILDDGTFIFWRSGTNEEEAKGALLFDTNGKKGPNELGKDSFEFAIKNDKVIPGGLPITICPFHICCKTNSGYGCTAWVIYKGNMDYLHCDGLTWTSRSCKDK